MNNAGYEIAIQGRMSKPISATDGTWTSDDINDQRKCASTIIVAAGTTISSMKYKRGNGQGGFEEGAIEASVTAGYIGVVLPTELIIGELDPKGRTWLVTEIVTTGGGAVIYGI